MPLPRPVPDCGELSRLDPKAALLQVLLGGVPAAVKFTSAQPPGKSPSAAVGSLSSGSLSRSHRQMAPRSFAGASLPAANMRAARPTASAGGRKGRDWTRPVWAIACNSRAQISQSGSLIDVARRRYGAERATGSSARGFDLGMRALNFHIRA
jgi:hypothetical protein